MMGIEPTTPGTTIRCSNQLSYTRRPASLSEAPVLRQADEGDEVRFGQTIARALRERCRAVSPCTDNSGDSCGCRYGRRPGPCGARDDRGGSSCRRRGGRPHPGSRRRRHRCGNRGTNGAGPRRAAVVRDRRRGLPALLRRGARSRGDLRRARDCTGRRRRTSLLGCGRCAAPLAGGRRRRPPCRSAGRRADARTCPPRPRPDALGAALRVRVGTRRTRLRYFAAPRIHDREEPQPRSLPCRPHLLLPSGTEGRSAPARH